MAVKEINNIFQIVETKFMVEASDVALAVVLDNLVEICNKFGKDQILPEIKKYHRRLCYNTSADVVSKWTA